VLVDKVLDALQNIPLLVFVDATIGAGGHSEAVINSHPEIQQLIGIDVDPTALSIAEKRLSKWEKKIVLLHDNYSQIRPQLSELNIHGIDAALLDLGVSSMQLDRPERGFSFAKEGPLDMRMNPETSLCASDIVNTWPEQELGRIFRKYGEEKRWRQAAKAIVNARLNAPIKTTLELNQALKSTLHSYRKQGIHPFTLVYQALRICVNRELERLEETIPQLISILNPGGRLCVISFHSLEDRIVKNAFRYAASDKENTRGIGGVFLSKKPEVRLVTKKPLTASASEVALNPRSRSAKLRVVEKIA